MKNRDIFLAVLMLVIAGIAYWMFQHYFYLDRMKVRGAKVYLSVGERPITLELAGDTFGDAELKNLRTAPEIKKLILAGSSVTDDGMKSLVSTDLIELDLSGTQVTDKGLQYLTPVTTLKRIDLSETKVTGIGLKYLASFPHLDTLRLDRCRKMTSSEILLLAKCHSLKNLSLSDFPITYSDLITLENALPELHIEVDAHTILKLRETDPLVAKWNEETRMIRVSRRIELEGNDEEINLLIAKCLERIESREAVESLKLSWSSDTPAKIIDSMKSFPNLTSLSLFCDIQQRTIDQISQFTELESLWLVNPRRSKFQPSRSQFSLSPLKQLKRLRELHLSGLHAQPDSFAAIQSLDHLRSLIIGQCNLQDQHILFLTNLPQLELVGLSENLLTEASLPVLENYPNLQLWDLEGNPINAEIKQVFYNAVEERAEELKAD